MYENQEKIFQKYEETVLVIMEKIKYSAELSVEHIQVMNDCIRIIQDIAKMQQGRKRSRNSVPVQCASNLTADMGTTSATDSGNALENIIRDSDKMQQGQLKNGLRPGRCVSTLP